MRARAGMGHTRSAVHVPAACSNALCRLWQVGLWVARYYVAMLALLTRTGMTNYMNVLTLDEIQERVEKIAAFTADYEAAHGLEDQLWHDFIKYVASGIVDEQMAEKARAVLQTTQIDFPRYCA